MKYIKIADEQHIPSCIHCKQRLATKCIISQVNDDDLQQVHWLDSHKACSLIQFEKCVLDNEITEVKKHLIKLQRKRATLEYKQFLKSAETIADV
jgi:hypothetical protein